MKKMNALALFCLSVCLSVFGWATAAAQITVPVHASECEIPTVFDRFAEEYGAPPQITGVERTGDTQVRIHFDADPLERQFLTPGSSYLVSIELFSARDGSRFPATERADEGLTIIVDGVQAMDDGMQIEILYDYSNVPLDGDMVFASKYMYYDLQGNPLRMIFEGRNDPTSYTFEYVNGAPALVEYMDDEYDNTGERIIANYSGSTGELTDYEYAFYVCDEHEKRLGSLHIHFNAYGEMEYALYWPEGPEFVDCEWDPQQGRWYQVRTSASDDDTKNYDVEVPEEVPDPTSVEPPVALPKPEGFGDFESGEFFGVPDIAVPLTAQEAQALIAPLPFDIAALPRPVSFVQEDGGCLVQLSWDGAEAVRSALGEDGALSGEIRCHYLWEDEQFGPVGGSSYGTVDFETLSARIGVPEYAPSGVELSVDILSPSYDVQTPDGSFTVLYDCWSEDDASGMELHEIDVTNGPYTNWYSPDGILLALEVSDSDGQGGGCTCYYDETGALSSYEYALTSNLSAEFDTNGLSVVYYFLDDGSEGSFLEWTPDGGWTVAGDWDFEADDYVYTPCDAPDGVDLSLFTPLI